METITGDTMAAAAASLSSGDGSTGTTPSTPSTTSADASVGTTTPASPAGSTTEVTTSPATTAPAPGSDVTGSEEITGPIPAPRHKAILERARAEHQAELQRVSQERDRYRQENEADAPIRTWKQEFQRDPIAAFGQLAEELQAHPQLGPQFRSQAARWLRGSGPARVAEPAAETPMPEPDTFDPSTGERFYSPKQAEALVKWQEQRVLGQVDQRLAPLQQMAQREAQREQQERERAAVQQAWQGALERTAVTLGHWRKQPGFTEHEPQIRALVKQGVDLGMAYAQVVVPKLSQAQQSRVLSDLNRKASAGTVNPGQASTSAPGPPTSMRDAVARAFESAGMR